MTQLAVVGGGEGPGGRTLVVGVKLESQSRELLTWVLVKLARAGDSVVALHILDSNEIVDRDGKSCLLSLVKSFDSVLAVYEGFCNLKQVDLKLKICRGSSVSKVLVSEAKSYSATQVIVGTAQDHSKKHSSASVAKYCAKKLSKDCSVLAVNNGKIVFCRESNSAAGLTDHEPGTHRQNSLLRTIQRSLSKNTKVVSDGYSAKPMLKWHQDALDKSNAVKRKCPICLSMEADGSQLAKLSSDDENEHNSKAIISVPKLKAGPTLNSLFRESAQLKPGWPLLRSTALSNRKLTYSPHVRQISVVEWAMQLPSRYCSSFESSTKIFSDNGCEKEPSRELDGENGAIVSVGNDAVVPLSPERTSRKLPQELEGFHDKYSATCRLFEFQELVLLTSNFSPDNMIGKGGSSQVYRGVLPDGKELAVKILKPSENALREFTLEIEIITTLHHKNIVSLFGFCFEDNHLLLVYDFLSRGSLEENVHGAKKEPLEFGWSQRFKVAIGVAEAIDYLHNQDSQPVIHRDVKSYLHNQDSQPVIHRDVKSSNILLSEDFEPQLSDFGLARWASSTSSHITCSDVAGTFGYLAPEYFMFGKVNEKIDVYAYGVVLLELLSGRRPICSNCPKGQESLVMWAKPILNSSKFSGLLDPNLGGCYNHEQMERMILAASLCIRRAPRARPAMSFVLELLRGEEEAVKWARLQVNDAEGSNVKLEANALEGSDLLEDDTFSKSNLRSHLSIALLGVEEDFVSVSSTEQTLPFEDYMQGRWSRSSSFD